MALREVCRPFVTIVRRSDSRRCDNSYNRPILHAAQLFFYHRYWPYIVGVEGVDGWQKITEGSPVMGATASVDEEGLTGMITVVALSILLRRRNSSKHVNIQRFHAE